MQITSGIDVKVWDAAQPFVDEQGQLHSGEMKSWAAVRTGTEGPMPVSLYLTIGGQRAVASLTIDSPQAQHHLRAGRDRDIPDGDLAGGHSGQRRDRWLETKNFVNKGLGLLGIGAQFAAQLRIGCQRRQREANDYRFVLASSTKRRKTRCDSLTVVKGGQTGQKTRDIWVLATFTDRVDQITQQMSSGAQIRCGA
jgi:hypothetical protein